MHDEKTKTIFIRCGLDGESRAIPSIEAPRYYYHFFFFFTISSTRYRSCFSFSILVSISNSTAVFHFWWPRGRSIPPKYRENFVFLKFHRPIYEFNRYIFPTRSGNFSLVRPCHLLLNVRRVYIVIYSFERFRQFDPFISINFYIHTPCIADAAAGSNSARLSAIKWIYPFGPISPPPPPPRDLLSVYIHNLILYIVSSSLHLGGVSSSAPPRLRNPRSCVHTHVYIRLQI